jgi:hypothetical protein
MGLHRDRRNLYESAALRIAGKYSDVDEVESSWKFDHIWQIVDKWIFFALYAHFCNAIPLHVLYTLKYN